jgi:hypothetical protein
MEGDHNMSTDDDFIQRITEGRVDAWPDWVKTKVVESKWLWDSEPEADDGYWYRITELHRIAVAEPYEGTDPVHDTGRPSTTYATLCMHETLTTDAVYRASIEIDVDMAENLNGIETWRLIGAVAELERLRTEGFEYDAPNVGPRF